MDLQKIKLMLSHHILRILFMKPFSRAERVGGQIQKILSDLIRKKIKDPRLDMATITGTKISSDLREAIIFFTTYSGEKGQKAALEGFKSASGYLKKELGKQLKIRFVPNLKFIHDDSFDYGTRIDSLLDSLKKEENSDE